jgi:Mg-chelatase subunit ChlD
MSHKSKGKSLVTERGVAVVLVALALVAMLAALGLALDTGRVLLAYQRLQHAVDAAVMGHMDYVNQLPNDMVEGDAVAMARSNLELARYGSYESEITSTVTPAEARLLVNGTLRVPLMFLPVLPGTPRDVALQASAQSGGDSVAVILLLDTSDSMSESVDGLSGPSKIERMREAATAFIGALGAADFLGVVEFKSQERVVRSLGPLSRGRQSVLRSVSELTADGDTCIACALREARRSFRASSESANRRRVVVLFTDGVPKHNEYNDERPLDPGHPLNIRLGTSCGWTNEVGSVGGVNLDLIGRRRFYQSIAESDLLRSMGIEVHTIGIGRINVDNGDICRGMQSYGMPNRNPWQRWYCSITGQASSYQEWERERDLDLQLLRPFFLMRLANSLDVDLPYNPGLNGETESPITYDPATGDLRGAFPAFATNLPPGVVPSPQCVEDPNAGYCACIPRIGPDFPRGLFLAANSADQLTDRFLRIFQAIRVPRFRG